MAGGNRFRSLAVGGGGGTLLTDVGLLLVRVGFGGYMAVAHGLGKIKNPGAMASYVENLGLPAPTAMAWMAGVTEFFGAIFLVLGIVTRPVATLLAGVMSVAVFIAHSKDPFIAGPGQPSRELPMLYLCVFILFMLAGGGRFSLDALLRKKG